MQQYAAEGGRCLGVAVEMSELLQMSVACFSLIAAANVLLAQ
jgi:hypothetical protein